MNLLDRFKEYIKVNHLFSPKDKLLLAVSGGVDSVVLCELCKQAGFDFAIAHCNFQLREEESNRDEQFVAQLSKKYGVEFFVKTFDTKLIALQQKKSVEETARNLRYQWFDEFLIHNKHIPGFDFILTAHHADDTIETVLMNFFRGTGIKGLRGILPKTGKVIRPLLFARRKELEDFVKDNKLSYVIDSTNFENEYTRNFFRNKILPLIKEYFHAADENILRNADRFIEVEELYNQAIAQYKKKLLVIRPHPHNGTEPEIYIPVLKLQKSTPLRSIVYEIIKDYGFTSHQTEEVISLLDSGTGKYISSSTHRIIKYRKWLIIAPLKTDMSETILIEQWENNIQCPLFTLQLFLEENTDQKLPATNNLVHLDAGEVTFPLLLRKWKRGDYFYPLGMKKKKKLSRFFIDNKLPQTEKEKIWVLESNKRIMWVIGYRIDDRFKITDKTKQILKIGINQT
ncbi:MAG TPA: tRNA lysidine(34) synthetase TilS [Chitinophagaceae bacterium]|nr:tRNA lysidine(34) synthetase TilS [Chitinophagaceae bacterium]